MPGVTLSGLIERRSALAAALDEARDRVAVLTASLNQLDKTIKRRGLNGDPASIKPQRLVVRHGPRERGPIVRPVLTILRRAGEPLTLRDITLRVIDDKGLDAADVRVRRNVGHQVKMALANQRKQGIVLVVRAPGQRGLWGIAD